jgi:hypothetical protein
MTPSFPRKRESRLFFALKESGTHAFAGVTKEDLQ